VRIGIVGAGMIGGALAHRLVAAGYDVVLANRRGPATLAPLLDTLGPTAKATSVEAVAAAGELLVLAVPFGATRDLPLGAGRRQGRGRRR
jgi:predicted dinucleotide-binding enzyme